MSNYCCENMEYFASYECADHKNKYTCPDCIIDINEQNQTYGIIIHDGGESVIRINFCPWCGMPLDGSAIR